MIDDYAGWIIAWVALGGLVGYFIGKEHRREGSGVVLGMLFGIIGWIILVVLIVNDQRPRCPECLGAVPPRARKCKHCGSDLIVLTSIPLPEPARLPQAPAGQSPYDEPVEVRRHVNCPACGYGMMATDHELHHGLKCSRCKIGFIPAAPRSHI